MMHGLDVPVPHTMDGSMNAPKMHAGGWMYMRSVSLLPGRTAVSLLSKGSVGPLTANVCVRMSTMRRKSRRRCV